MTKPKRRPSVDDRPALLDEQLARSDSSGATELLRAALADSSASVVRKAAKLAAEQLCYELIPVLTATFDRLIGDDPVKHDPSCLGKAAIAKALLELDYLDIDFFRHLDF